jgi:hypothetical protein
MRANIRMHQPGAHRHHLGPRPPDEVIDIAEEMRAIITDLPDPGVGRP